jgi:hypothetical protein
MQLRAMPDIPIVAPADRWAIVAYIRAVSQRDPGGSDGRPASAIVEMKK